jgi:hypothetical protein
VFFPDTGVRNIFVLGSGTMSRIMAAPDRQQHLALLQQTNPELKVHAPDLELPKHLYTETRAPDGTLTDITFIPEKLIAWYEYSQGEALHRWYQDICDREIEAITAWEDNQFLQLEETWLEQENGESDAAAEAQYELACQSISSKADSRREAVMTRIQESKAAIEELVLQSREHIASHQPDEPVDNTFITLLAIGGFITLVFMLIS